MPKPFLKSALLALAALVASLASAQMLDGRERALHDPRLIAITAAEARAYKLVDRARQRLREGKLPQAEVLATAAVRECDEVNDKDALVLGMLAEVYLAEGEPGVALGTLDEFKNGMEPDRRWRPFPL